MRDDAGASSRSKSGGGDGGPAVPAAGDPPGAGQVLSRGPRRCPRHARLAQPQRLLTRCSGTDSSMGACWPGTAVTLLRPTALGPQSPQGRSICATICPSRNPTGRPSCRSPRSSSSTGSPHSCHRPADGLDSPARSPMIPAPTNVFAPLPEASLRWYRGRNIAHGAVESPILNHSSRFLSRLSTYAQHAYLHS